MKICIFDNHYNSFDDIRYINSNHICSFYTDLYADIGPTCSSSLDVDSLIPSIVTNAKYSSLIAVPFLRSLRLLFFSMDGNSALGSYRFSGAFYCDCWDIIGLDVVAAVRQFFNGVMDSREL